MLKLKVCGLADLEQISALAAMPVDFLGFIFYERSPRFALNRLTLNEINTVEHAGKTGVFVNEKMKKVAAITRAAGLQYVQLHGDESAEEMAELRSELSRDIKIIKVVRVKSDLSARDEKEVELLAEKFKELEKAADFTLFDTDSAAYGGTGKRFDWQLINLLQPAKPYFLSGGISTDSVKTLENIRPQPFALDVNSRFENAPGDKNVDLITSFFEKLKNFKN